MLRTIISSPLYPSALSSSRSTEATLRFATGVKRQRPHQLSGDGSHLRESGTDGMTTSGTTGAHPRVASPPMDGPGIRATGITTAGSSSTTEDTGIDSKVASGSDTESKSQSSQPSQEVQRSADLSINSRNGASQSHLDPRLSQDAESDQAERPPTTCGKTEKHADSLVEDLSTKSTRPVNQEDHISGLESSDASKVQSSPRRD